jgi:hypothetical protein
MPTVDLGDGGSIAFTCRAVLRDGQSFELRESASVRSGQDRVLTFEGGGLTLRMHIGLDDGAARFGSSVWGEPAVLARLDRIVLVEADLGRGRFTRNYSARREIWLPTGLRTADNRPLPDGPPQRQAERAVIQDTNYDFAADNLIALYREGESALLAGVAYPGRQGLEMSFVEGVLRIAHCCDAPPSMPGRIAPDSFVLRFDRPLVESLEWYGRMNRVAPRGSHERASVTAWNTWDYFHAHITQDDVIRCADLIAADPALKARIQAIVLDDGWSISRGDWTPNERFPDIAQMCRAIRDRGFLPGIWYSPFRIDSASSWAKEHPQTLLWGEQRDCYAKPLTRDGKTAYLDYSHPLVLEKIFDDLSRMRRWGFRYFKTDFLQGPNSNFRRPELADPGCSPAEGVRRAMHAIRAAIGYDSFWLACGTEFLPVAGLADAARISDDITLHFSTVQVAVRHCAMYFWANRNLWLTDPDFLVVRGPQTSASPHLSRAEELGHPRKQSPYERCVLHSGPLVTAEESRTWANFQIVYGGALAWSDHPGELTPAGMSMVGKVLEWHEGSGPGVPLDLAENNLPRKWLRPARGGWLLGLFNFDDEAREIRLTARDLARIGPVTSATDIWTGQRQPWSANGLAVGLPAHHSRVIHLQTGDSGS